MATAILNTRFARRICIRLSVLVFFACAQWAATAPVLAADARQGEALHQAKCDACHAQKSPFGDPQAIYRRSDRKVTSIAKLNSMVALCNTELRLDLFPEDEQDLSAFLNQRYYQFK